MLIFLYFVNFLEHLLFVSRYAFLLLLCYYFWPEGVFHFSLKVFSILHICFHTFLLSSLLLLLLQFYLFTTIIHYFFDSLFSSKSFLLPFLVTFFFPILFSTPIPCLFGIVYLMSQLKFLEFCFFFIFLFTDLHSLRFCLSFPIFSFTFALKSYSFVIFLS